MAVISTRASLLSLAVLAGLMVSGAQAADRYKISADGQTVVDTATNLEWRRCAEGMKWENGSCAGKPTMVKLVDAKAIAAEANKADNKGWRVPNKEELAALVVKGKKKPTIDADIFPNTPATLFWSLRPGFDDNLNAWLVSFGNGKVYGNSGEKKFNVRLVRTNS
jgi:hypothetical protein